MTPLMRRTFLTALIVLLTSITGGCSWFIASRGVPGPDALHVPQTRAEVRDQFGAADEIGTCPDGRVVERRWIRQKVDWLDKSCAASPGVTAGLACSALSGAYQGSAGLFDIFVVPVYVYRSERAKLHYAFVYDETDRVLYRYDLAASVLTRFADVMRPLGEALYAQLADGKCGTWTACLTDYAQEVRRRAACVGYTLGVEDEQKFERMLAIGEAMDAGRILREEALANLAEMQAHLTQHPR